MIVSVKDWWLFDMFSTLDWIFKEKLNVFYLWLILTIPLFLSRNLYCTWFNKSQISFNIGEFTAASHISKFGDAPTSPAGDSIFPVGNAVSLAGVYIRQGDDTSSVVETASPKCGCRVSRGICLNWYLQFIRIEYDYSMHFGISRIPLAISRIPDILDMWHLS